MTKDEIRNDIKSDAFWLREIAAQLAEKNDLLRESIDLRKESMALVRESNATQKAVATAFETPASVAERVAERIAFTYLTDSPVSEIAAVVRAVLEGK